MNPQLGENTTATGLGRASPLPPIGELPKPPFDAVPAEIEDPIVELARFSREIRFEDLPQPLVEFAKRDLLDLVGISMGGSSQAGIPALVDYFTSQGGKPESLLPYHGNRLPAPSVAFVMGAMTRALDMGDLHHGIPERGSDRSAIRPSIRFRHSSQLSACSEKYQAKTL